MRELLAAPLFVYGCLVGLLTIWGLSNTKDHSETQMQEMQDALVSIVGEDTTLHKKILSKLHWGVFAFYAVFSLVSLYVFVYHTVGLVVSLILFITEIVEHATHLFVVRNSESVKDIPYKSNVSKIASLIHLIGVASILGLLL